MTNQEYKPLYKASNELCGIGACPTIQEQEDSYLIIGKQIDPQEAGLVGKVGQGEALIKVPRELIDKIQK